MGSALLAAVYRDRVKWVSSTVGSFTVSVSFDFFEEKSEKCGFVLTVL